ncbi:MAG: hypothetical protein KF741_14070 [Ferruginibacter sp.]|nr:hypothetical protein [Bacteroidota bacterium]MBX2920360.1 hypothetical protein [Ferruginibacter sp.]MCB0710487.1 hypothetical protein [Chitinophagaceae bacterium]MCC7379352.1 hypothetical protein [Chitinophagaceae bacterium]
MDNRFTKYSKLYVIIFLLFLSVPVILALLVAFFWGLSKIVSSNVADIVFGLGLITIAPALFSTVYFIFFKRTAKHPVAAVRYVSKIIFVAGIIISIVVLIADMISFFTKYATDISAYRCYSLPFLAGNIATLFLIAIIQAFTTKKEVDWMDRQRI